MIAFSMTKLSPRGFKFKLSLLRDYLLPMAFELRNLSGPLKISLLHLLFMCLLLCLVVLLLSYINTQPGTRLGRGGSMASPFIPFFFVCFFYSFNRPTSNGPDPWLLMAELIDLEKFRKVTSSLGAVSVPVNGRVVAVDEHQLTCHDSLC